MKNNEENTDILIIGAGAAGSVFAKELSESGVDRVTVLEFGKHYKDHYEEFKENEASVFDLTWDNSDYEIVGDGYNGGPNLGAGVGGGTLAWNALSFRFFERDFNFKSHYGAPEGTSVEDWPINLSDLEKHYDKAERQMGVSGAITVWDEPDRKPPPNPPFEYYCASQYLADGMERLGLRTGPAPVAINSRKFAGRPECLHCGFCRSGCRIDAKYQSDVALLSDLLDDVDDEHHYANHETTTLDLRTETVVKKIHTTKSGKRVSGVTYYDKKSGKTKRINARLIVACNNPLEIPRLFLNSRSEYHPKGLGNRYDQVGRNFFCHPTTVAVGVTDQTINANHGYNIGNVITLDYTESYDHNQHVGGFAFMSLNGAGATVLAVDPYKHLWGQELKDAMRTYNNSLFALCFCEGMPVNTNRISVNNNVLDKFGVPTAKIEYHLHENDKKVFSSALKNTKDILVSSGAHSINQTDFVFESHPMGSMRMGNNVKTSVTDSYGKVHGIDNLFIGGAALFVTGSSVNPTLTIHALALRTAEYIKDNLHDMFDDHDYD